jgi:ubiquinone/menaquinone biosynthesis C-methylase UbiE
MTSEVFEKLQTFKQWDDDYYPPAARRYYDRAFARLLQYLTPQHDEPILDAGCGPGLHSIRVACAGYSVHAIDISATVLEEARRRATEAGVVDRICFKQGDHTELNLPSASYDAVFSWGVLMHIPDLSKALEELVRVLKPGGRLALQTTNGQAWDYLGERLARLVLRKHKSMEQHEFWTGCWYVFQGERLWVWGPISTR